MFTIYIGKIYILLYEFKLFCKGFLFTNNEAVVIFNRVVHFLLQEKSKVLAGVKAQYLKSWCFNILYF